ncbi:MAG: class aldolase/adducin family protein [Ilumatobacteraceae bacterium]|nr:class aldolase/adducin family protein [Ilumatobacteraceae bacterium]
MTAIDTDLSPDVAEFVDQTLQAARHAFGVLHATGSLLPSGTVQINERVPGHDKLVGINYPNPWKSRSPQLRASVYGFDGTSFAGDPRAARGARRFAAVFEQHADVTTVVHVHSPYLGAVAQVHSVLPIRGTDLHDLLGVDELPVYIDRRQAEVDFILQELASAPTLNAIVEANGGATAWGRNGLADTARQILAIEQAARAYVLAASLATH